MAGITRDEVLHVARLARLELTDDEVEKFQEQLSAILEAVSKVSELDLSDVPPTAHPLEIQNAWAEDEPRPSLQHDDVFANAPDRDGRPLQDAAGMTVDTLTLTAEEANQLLGAKEISSDELFAAYLRGDRRARPGAARLPLRLRRRARATGIPIAIKDVIGTKGDPDDGRLEDARELRAGLRRDRDRALQGARPAHPRQDEHRRVRDGLVDRELRVRPVAQPVGPDARPRRLGRRQRGRRQRRARAVGARLRHRRLDQAAVGALRQRRPAADLRHRLALRRRRVRVVARPGRPGREERARLRASCTRSSPAATRTTRRPSTSPRSSNRATPRI